MPTMQSSKSQQVSQDANLAYIIGVSIGDGNLSNPNGRAVRLRITCDKNYPEIIARIQDSIQEILPRNRVSIVYRKDNCVDISCYSNKWESILGWTVGSGPKHVQGVSVPKWIKQNASYSTSCLKGLFETDGSIYKDRKYIMVNFVTIIPSLATDVVEMISGLGFMPNLQILKPTQSRIINTKYTIRISKNSRGFIKKLNLVKN